MAWENLSHLLFKADSHDNQETDQADENENRHENFHIAP
jgi:hypothetical protein